MLKWDLYTITTKSTSITGVMFRGRFRKFCLENDQDVLVENATDVKGAVRYAIPSMFDPTVIDTYVHSILSDASIVKELEGVENPVLSKLKVNESSRYVL